MPGSPDTPPIPPPKPQSPADGTGGAAPRAIRTADLRVPFDFDLRPDAADRAALAADLGLLGLTKLRLHGRLAPARGGIALDATLGATVVQPCSVTLAPVTTRIDEPVARRYMAGVDMPGPGTETEMPEDDSVEPLSDTIDLTAVLAEALSLALPAFPRAPGAALGAAIFAGPGLAPMTDADASPFAALKGLAAPRADDTTAAPDEDPTDGAPPDTTPGR